MRDWKKHLTENKLLDVVTAEYAKIMSVTVYNSNYFELKDVDVEIHETGLLRKVLTRSRINVLINNYMATFSVCSQLSLSQVFADFDVLSSLFEHKRKCLERNALRNSPFTVYVRLVYH